MYCEVPWIILPFWHDFLPQQFVESESDMVPMLLMLLLLAHDAKPRQFMSLDDELLAIKVALMQEYSERQLMLCPWVSWKTVIAANHKNAMIILKKKTSKVNIFKLKNTKKRIILLWQSTYVKSANFDSIW